MFDNLREEATSTPYYEETAATPQPTTRSQPVFAASGSRRVLGMTGLQRFIITVMLFMGVCLIGGMALLVLGKIGF